MFKFTLIPPPSKRGNIVEVGLRGGVREVVERGTCCLFNVYCIAMENGYGIQFYSQRKNHITVRFFPTSEPFTYWKGWLKK